MIYVYVLIWLDFFSKKEAELKHMRYENMRLRGILEEALRRYRSHVTGVVWL